MSIRPRTGTTFRTYSEKKARYGPWFTAAGIVGRIRGRARVDGMACDLTTEMFRAMWAAQAGLCHYTGRPMVLGEGTRSEPDQDGVSVDRKDNSKGYIVGNMVLCCRWVNVAKGCGTIDDLRLRAEELLAAVTLRRLT